MKFLCRLNYPLSLHLLNRSSRVCALKEAKAIQFYSMTTAISLDVSLRGNVRRMWDNSVDMSKDHDLFAEMPEWNVVSWTSMISQNAKGGFTDRALECFSQMQRVGVEPNEMTFSMMVGICRALRNIGYGMSLHCLILKKGFSRHSFIASGLISMYSKHDCVNEACVVFNETPERDAVVWNSMIVGYAQNNFNGEAISLFSMMLLIHQEGIFSVNGFILTSVLKACGGVNCIRIGKSVHNYAIKLNYSSDVFVAVSMIDMYSRFGSVDRARRIFNRMGKRDLVAWNSMISGYAQNSYSEEAIELFYQLQSENFLPNEITFTSVLKALAVAANSILGSSFHAKIIKGGYLFDVFVGTALIDMYSKCFDIEDAERAFKEIQRKNLVSFNALIMGYSPIGRYKEAIETYIDLLRENMRPDAFTLSALLSSCSELGALLEGTEVHAHSIKFGLDSNASVGNSLVGVYCKCNLTDDALKAFESVTTPNTMSWAGIISGFAQNGEGENALKYFNKMLLSEKPDEFSLSSILKVLASWAATEHGRHMHAYVIKRGIESDIFVGSALVDMYSKCGMMEDSSKVFTSMPRKNVISWNSMIMGYAQNGFSQKALCLFGEMEKLSVTPTSVTFIGILLVCSYTGLVGKGRHFFNMMVSDYRILPSVEHCTCMVDLLGRAGHLDEAETFLLNSQFSSEPSIWKSLLAACRVHRNSDIAIRVAEHCLHLEPHDSSTYVLLSNIYASKCLWAEVERIRILMREVGIEKEPGCSWIDIRNSMYVFISDDRFHSANVEIVTTLKSLIVQSKNG
ncbi:hypothetical protein MRB53_006595 [Persea americana]|uniref:Uncharacterized protein n=1 Tax=Persea americana TaxID=3435 RepID=A0ACC2MGF9_PERAE|nr:hypothetical protein MRB53_006595 [Persea americana]